MSQHYRIKLDGSGDAFQELSTEQMLKKERNTETVSVKVSKRMLKHMKSIAGIQNEVSDNKILYAFIKTVLDTNRP